MDKKLFWIRNITFLVAMILYCISFSGLQSVSYGPQWNILYGFLILCLLVETIIFIFVKHEVNEDNKYNIMFIIVNLLFMFIYLRTMFDNSITTVYIANKLNDTGLTEVKYNFLSSNIQWFVYLNLGLILYPFTYLKWNQKGK